MGFCLAIKKHLHYYLLVSGGALLGILLFADQIVDVVVDDFPFHQCHNTNKRPFKLKRTTIFPSLILDKEPIFFEMFGIAGVKLFLGIGFFKMSQDR
jgi:hypothetical protein